MVWKTDLGGGQSVEEPSGGEPGQGTPSGAVQQLVLWIRPSPVGERLLHNTRVAPHRSSTTGRRGAEVPVGRQGMRNTSWPPPPEVKVIRCLPLESEIEVRPLNIPVGLAPRPCPAVKCRAVLQWAQGITGSHMVAACLHAMWMLKNRYVLLSRGK